MVEIFRAGFIGATTDDATEWVAEHAKGANSICVPFAGSGRDISSMAQTANEGAQIDSWDVQYLSHAAVNGIFNQAPEISIYEPKFKKGRMYETRFLKNIDARCAGLFDYIAANGSLYEHSALISATVRATMVGRMTHWDTDVDKFWRAFKRYCERNSVWHDRFQGIKFNHIYGSFFDDTPDKEWDLVQIDPPKVVTSRDVYSKGPWAKLQYCLGQDVEITEWTKRDAGGYLRTAFGVKAKKIVFLYTTGVRPTYQEMQRIVSEYGELVEVKEFHHQNRTDIGYVVEKTL